MQKYQVMVILLILIHGLLSTLHAERIIRCKIVYFARQRFARVMIDVETLRSVFVNILRVYTLFINAY